jgi:nucleotide-binding universal stress UspA family protein
VKRFKNLLVYLSLDSNDFTLIRYLAEFAALCESQSIQWVSRRSYENTKPETGSQGNTAKKPSGHAQSVFEGLWTERFVPENHCVFMHGDPVQELCRIASEHPTDLIVANQQAFKAQALEHLVRIAPCSVLLVSPCSTPHFRKILVPIDFSDTSRQCAMIGANLAKTRQVNRLFLYHAIAIPLNWQSGEESPESKRIHYTQEIRKKMQQWKHDLESPDMSMNCHLSMEYVPWRGISKFGEQLQPDLLILGLSQAKARKPTIGDTTAKVMRHLNTTILFHRLKHPGIHRALEPPSAFQPKAA